MNITDSKIDKGKAFDWGRVSEDYSKYRDIYPDEFYRRLADMDICVKGQKVLDLGTGTGVLPRNMYKYGAEFIGTDISENRIEYAKILAKNQNMKACRGTGASLTPEKTAEWETEHIRMLEKTAPEKFNILHYCATAILNKK